MPKWMHTLEVVPAEGWEGKAFAFLTAAKSWHGLALGQRATSNSPERRIFVEIDLRSSKNWPEGLKAAAAEDWVKLVFIHVHCDMEKTRFSLNLVRAVA